MTRTRRQSTACAKLHPAWLEWLVIEGMLPLTHSLADVFSWTIAEKVKELLRVHILKVVSSFPPEGE